jgi:hypothetical protein
MLRAPKSVVIVGIAPLGNFETRRPAVGNSIGLYLTELIDFSLRSNAPDPRARLLRGFPIVGRYE